MSREDELVRHGAFIALRMDAGHAGGMYQVSMGGPLFGAGYFNESGSDLLALMRAAARFHDDSAIARQ
jgi:hypothetical protein